MRTGNLKPGSASTGVVGTGEYSYANGSFDNLKVSGTNITHRSKVVTDGHIEAIKVYPGGSNYTSPTVTISAPPAGGTQATAVATLGTTVTYGAATYPPVYSDTYVKATSVIAGGYYAYQAVNPTLSLTGTWASNSWYSANLSITNQRFHIDLGSAKIINKIYYENSHHVGGYTNRGVKDFTFWGSNDPAAFANLSYATDSGWTQLTTNVTSFLPHVDRDQCDPHEVNVTNTTAYQYYAFKFANNYGDVDYMGVRRLELIQGTTYTNSITGITLTNKGSGYVVDTDTNTNPYPIVTITDSTGSGAVATAYVPTGLPQSDGPLYYGPIFALMADKTVRAWGLDPGWSAGYGDYPSSQTMFSPATSLFEMSVDEAYNTTVPNPVRIIDGGGQSSYILTSDGSLWGAGENGNYELGLGDTPTRYTFYRIRPYHFNYKPIIKMKTGSTTTGNQSCGAINSDGELFMWGYNNQGQLGTGNTTSQKYPVKMNLGVAVVDFCFTGSGSALGTLILDANGAVWHCGYDGYGCHSSGATSAYSISTPVKCKYSSGTDMSGITAIAGAGSYTYGTAYYLRNTGVLYAAGYGVDGELGDNTVTNTIGKTGYANVVLNEALTTLTNVNKIWASQGGGTSTGGSTSSLFARDTSGNIYCWGYNGQGQLGTYDTTLRNKATLNTRLMAIKGTATVVDIIIAQSIDYYSTRVLLSDGRIYATGFPISGALGIGYTTTTYTWNQVLLPRRDVVGIKAWNYSSTEAGFYVLTSDGTYWACGHNGHGQLGNGTTQNPKSGLSPVVF